jgi:hypothetical protein
MAARQLHQVSFASVGTAVYRVIKAVVPISWSEDRPVVNQEPKKVIHTEQLVRQNVGWIITAVSEKDTEGCKMKYSPVSSSFPSWKVAREAPTLTERDAAFFRKIGEAAQVAERKHGEKLRAKFGPRMPKQPEEGRSLREAEKIATELGAKVFRS